MTENQLEFLDILINTTLKNKLKYPEWRLGQSLFNTLHILDANLSIKVRGTTSDCFYQDDKIKEFLIFVIDNMEK